MQPEETRFEFLDPWWPTDDRDENFQRVFLRELRTEIGPEHVLFDVPVRVIGRDGGSDDTLFEILDGSGRVALVHLTWSKSRERPPWPGTAIFPNFGAFAAEVMNPKHQEYMEGREEEDELQE